MINKIIKILFLTFSMISLNANSMEKDWVNLGHSAVSDSIQIYIDKNSIKKLENDIFVASTYEDMGVTQSGLDMTDSDGTSRYITDINYRSSRSIDFYDCKNKLIANVETSYYKNEIPNKKDLIYKQKEKELFWIDVIIEKKIFNYVCGK